VSGCQNLIASQTPRPITVKFSRKAQLNCVGKIGIVFISGVWGAKNTKSWRKHLAKLFTEQKMFKFHSGNARYPQVVSNTSKWLAIHTWAPAKKYFLTPWPEEWDGWVQWMSKNFPVEIQTKFQLENHHERTCSNWQFLFMHSKIRVNKYLKKISKGKGVPWPTSEFLATTKCLSLPDLFT